MIALVGMLRDQQQRSIPHIHKELLRRGLHVAQRTVIDQLYCYEGLVALYLANSGRLKTPEYLPMCVNASSQGPGLSTLLSNVWAKSATASPSPTSWRKSS